VFSISGMLRLRPHRPPFDLICPKNEVVACHRPCLQRQGGFRARACLPWSQASGRILDSMARTIARQAAIKPRARGSWSSKRPAKQLAGGFADFIITTAQSITLPFLSPLRSLGIRTQPGSRTTRGNANDMTRGRSAIVCQGGETGMPDQHLIRGNQQR